MKDRACFTVRAEGRELTLCYTVRELKFLGGPPLPAGHRLVRALGVFDNFTVAKGQDTHAWTSRDRQELLAVAYDLFQSISVALPVRDTAPYAGRRGLTNGGLF